MKIFRLLVAFTLICFALLPVARAVVPAPDGGYANGNTAEGTNALLSLSTGGFNTAVGWFSLKSVTAGKYCTGLGAATLLSNTADSNTATGAGALLRTQQAPETQLTEHSRSLAIPPAAPTQPSEMSRSRRTLEARTRHWVMLLCKITRPGVETQPLVISHSTLTGRRAQTLPLVTWRSASTLQVLVTLPWEQTHSVARKRGITIRWWGVE